MDADGDVAVHQVRFVEFGQADALTLVGLLDDDCLEFCHGACSRLIGAVSPALAIAQAGRQKFSNQAAAGAGLATGFSTIGRLMIAEAMPRMMVPHQITS